MPIDHKDFMHGAALVAIADSPEFTALNKASTKYGHYIVNHDRNVFIKYSDGNGTGDYSFTFHPDDKQRIQDIPATALVHIVLVCGKEVITGLSRDELGELIDRRSPATETVKVQAATGKQLRLSGPGGRQIPPIPRSAFPRRVLT
jgi:hypothetical protein